ncbi:MAG: hydrolase [Kiritimatiellia bacterium]|nr:hydrolase [Kiritimatiellia bacterium]
MNRLQRASALTVLIDAQEKLMAVMRNRQALEDRILCLLRGCRALDIPILSTEQTPEKLGPTLSTLAEQIPGGPAVPKRTFSCVRSEEFVRRLEESGRTQIVLAGIESHVCVYQTAIDLMEEDYEVFVVTDCVRSRHEEDQTVALQEMGRAGILLATLEMVLFQGLGSADDPAFREILRMVK